MEAHLADFIKDTADGREAETILRTCVHCGFCTATCPTYQLLGDELDGPRGRIYLMKQMLEGGTVTARPSSISIAALPAEPARRSARPACVTAAWSRSAGRWSKHRCLGVGANACAAGSCARACCHVPSWRSPLRQAVWRGRCSQRGSHRR